VPELPTKAVALAVAKVTTIEPPRTIEPATEKATALAVAKTIAAVGATIKAPAAALPRGAKEKRIEMKAIEPAAV
jgi:hypothetical protein